MGSIQMKLVVFDLDGTLNRTDLYAVPAHRTAFEELGMFGMTDEEIISNFGASDSEYLKKMVPHLNGEQARRHLSRVAELESYFMKEFHGEYEGVTDMMSELKEQGYWIAVCSNSSQTYIRMVLDTLNLSRFVDEIQELIEGKDKVYTLSLLLKRLRPQAAVMVGDRFYDMDAAVENGIPFIGCAYGYGKEAEMAAANVMVNCAGDITKAVRGLIGA
mgnify:CR=1 FL=1